MAKQTKFQQTNKNNEIHITVKKVALDNIEDGLFIIYAPVTKQSFINIDVAHSINIYSKYQALRRKLKRQALTRKDLIDYGLI